MNDQMQKIEITSREIPGEKILDLIREIFKVVEGESQVSGEFGRYIKKRYEAIIQTFEGFNLSWLKPAQEELVVDKIKDAQQSEENGLLEKVDDIIKLLASMKTLNNQE